MTADIHYNRLISNCLASAAAGFAWNVHRDAERHHSLCPHDERALELIIAHAQQELIPLTVPRAIEEAQTLKEAHHRAGRILDRMPVPGVTSKVPHRRA
jgi:hypothetical protein